MSKSTSSPAQLKKNLRKQSRKRRRQLSPQQQCTNSIGAQKQFFTSPWRFSCTRIGVYLSQDHELDTRPLIDRLWQQNRLVCLPVMRGDELEFYAYHPCTPLRTNEFGILQPDPERPGASRFVDTISLDLLLVPLVSFDHLGTRLGMGGGYYDRHLANLPIGLRPKLVGFAHDVQQAQQVLPKETWDIGLDGMITNAGWQQFSNK